MKIYIQWAKSVAEDWKPLEVRNNHVIASLSKRGVPNANSTVDDKDGWICGLNCQGIDFTGHDHVAVEVVPGGLRITAWNDDEEDSDQKVAVEWTLLEPAHDPRVGKVNTVQSVRLWTNFDYENALPWDEFVPPPANLTMHGVWMDDVLFEEHVKVRKQHGWREWV